MTTSEIKGHGRDQARRVLAAAMAAGLPASSVRTSQAGYLLPEEALEHYEQIAQMSDEEFEAARKVGVQENGIVSYRLATDSDSVEPEGDADADGDGESKTDGESESGEGDSESSEPELEFPKGNASQEAWENFAAEHFGYNPEEGLSRNELVEKYGKSATAAE